MNVMVNVTENNDLLARELGDPGFRKDYGLKYAYLSGAMYRGIASKELVVAMGKAGLMGFLGVGGVKPDKVAADIDYIQRELSEGQSYGINLLNDLDDPQAEMATVELYIAKGVSKIEAAAFMQVTPALVYFRLSGMYLSADGRLECRNRIMAKISRPEVAQAFMSPAPEEIVEQLLAENKITQEQAQWSRQVPLSEDICVEADSGGHTDQGIATVLLPSVQSLREQLMTTYGYQKPIRVGLAGGIGTPAAAASAFMMDADFVLTGSINQCTVEAGTSDSVKDMLQVINVQDTDYAPAGDMFEIGAKVQVMKKSVLFPARANKLFSLYGQYASIDDIPQKVRKQLESKVFKQSFEEVWQGLKTYYEGSGRQHVIEKGERLPKHKMAMIFRWYFFQSTRLAFEGDVSKRVDFQVHTGPALGAFNQWVKGTELENWRNRHVDEIADMLMLETAKLINKKCRLFRSVQMSA
ncbi:MAG: permease [Alteromonadaceae bacterium]|nr:MAG: permease [Alteromonadaceae bacterium]